MTDSRGNAKVLETNAPPNEPASASTVESILAAAIGSQDYSTRIKVPISKRINKKFQKNSIAKIADLFSDEISRQSQNLTQDLLRIVEAFDNGKTGKLVPAMHSTPKGEFSTAVVALGAHSQKDGAVDSGLFALIDSKSTFLGSYLPEALTTLDSTGEHLMPKIGKIPELSFLQCVSILTKFHLQEKTQFFFKKKEKHIKDFFWGMKISTKGKLFL